MSDFRFTRPESFPPIVKNLLIINVLVWVAQLIFDEQYDLTGKLGMWPLQNPHFNPYQIATHMFTHASYEVDQFGNKHIIFFHILFNMFNLWMFGRILENVWGSKRFLFFYLACGVGAALTHMTVQYFEYKDVYQAIQQARELGYTDIATKIEDVPRYVVGASGAVMGVMVAFALLFPNTELYFMFLPIPIKAKWIIIGLVAIDLFFGLNPYQDDNVAHFAHLGGALTGFIIVMVWNRTNRRSLY
jgi:membrane associated rhomboid family serine protease